MASPSSSSSPSPPTPSSSSSSSSSSLSSPRSSPTPQSPPPPHQAHEMRHRQQKHQHQQQQHLHQSQSQSQSHHHTGSPVSSPVMTSTPPVTINGDAPPTYDFHFDFQSPVAAAHARHAQSPFMLATPSSKKHAAIAHPITCTFEALSQHFHLPLKVAAEKFGVRATAFKKRCRAIGIRHWPYRKVRSLKRSLEDLGRCKEEGTLTDKQTTQLVSYQKQLDKLLSPETYGIDPTSGRLLAGFHDDDDDENDSDNDDDDSKSMCGSRSSSSRFGSPYSSCSSARPPYKPRGAGRATLRGARGRPPMGHNQTKHFFYNMVHGGSANNYLDAPTLSDAAAMPSVSVRFATHAGHGGAGLPFETYDPFFSDFKGGEYSLTMEDFGDEDHP
ncbi:hypothetical protein PybrP1_006454, partial [[Pythium] brassicae (nom. inval.)]